MESCMAEINCHFVDLLSNRSKKRTRVFVNKSLVVLWNRVISKTVSPPTTYHVRIFFERFSCVMSRVDTLDVHVLSQCSTLTVIRKHLISSV